MAPQGNQRVWELRHTAYGVNDALVPLRKTLYGYSSRARDPLAIGGLRFQAPNFDLRLNFAYRARGRAVGALTTHSADFSGCGERDVLKLIRRYFGRRLGGPKDQERD